MDSAQTRQGKKLERSDKKVTFTRANPEGNQAIQKKQGKETKSKQHLVARCRAIGALHFTRDSKRFLVEKAYVCML